MATVTGCDLEPRDGTGDAIHQRLRAEIEKPESGYLWVPADAITFTPRLLPSFYGDGRALFALTTINQRPAYWIIAANMLDEISRRALTQGDTNG